MVNFVRTLIATFCVAVLPFSVVAGPTGEALQSFLDDTVWLSSEFQQKLTDETGALLEESSGTMVLARPDRFRWRYSEPYEQVIVGDGKAVWIYDADLKQVTVRPMGQAMAGSPALLLSSSQRLAQLFEVMEIGTRDGMEWVELKPRERDVAFNAIEVGLTDGKLASMRLRDNFGQVTELSFSALDRTAIDRGDVFKFIPPPGTDVVDER